MNNFDLDVFSSLLDSVYDAAVDPDHWRDFLVGLCATLDAKSGMFRVVDEREPAIRANIHHNLDPELQKAHQEYYIHRDVFVQALMDKPDVFIVPGEQILSPRKLYRSEFFADYMKPQDSYHVCGGLAMRNDEFTIMFGVQGDRNRGAFSSDDAAVIHRFVPHIQRATRLGHLLDSANQQSMTTEQALESLAVGIVLIDEQARVIHANTKADAALKHQRGLLQSGGQLSTTNQADASRFRENLRASIARSRMNAPAVPEFQLLTPTPEQPQTLLITCPIPPGKTRFQGPWPRACGVIFISNLSEAGLLNENVLMTLYSLTGAEARLACALARGQDLTRLSTEWQVSRETLRTHLKRILHKTGTHRQSELIRLLSGTPWNLLGEMHHA